MTTEADTCRKYLTLALRSAGWDDPPHSVAEQRTFTDGRIVPLGNLVHRLPQKRADYLLRYTRDFTLAGVEAKAEDRDEEGNLISSNLDLKNPSSGDPIKHVPPEALAADIMEKGKQILALMAEVQQALDGTGQ